METQEILDVSRQAIYVLIKISAPAMLVALGVGLLISLIQALTQMQEATLSFVPKILAIFITLVITMPFMVETLQTFTEELAQRIIGIESSP